MTERREPDHGAPAVGDDDLFARLHPAQVPTEVVLEVAHADLETRCSYIHVTDAASCHCQRRPHVAAGMATRHDDPVAGALLNDFYELNMASSYLRRGMAATATFSLFVRSLPPTRGFLVATGLEACLSYLERFCFGDDELAYLGSLGFDRATLDAFATLRFTGDVWAVPEGRIVFAGEPLLEVSAPIAEAQLAETVLCNTMTFHTTAASKAARSRIAAAGTMELVDFGFRRTQGIEAAMVVARATAMVGFAATSNVEAARQLGLTPAGTMAHSYVEAFPTETQAFRAFAEDVPEQATFLVDTYDTLGGVRKAVDVIRSLGLEHRAGIRLDSGDLSVLSKESRRILDEAGLPEVRIVVSGGLDEHRIADLVAAGAPVDVAGIGTRLGVSADAPYLDTVYKLVAYDGRPVAKLSASKETLPGAKQVFRAPGLVDVIGMREEAAPANTEPLLEMVMAGGHPIGPAAPLSELRTRFESDLVELPEAARALDSPVAPHVPITPALSALTRRVHGAARRNLHIAEGPTAGTGRGVGL